MSTETLERARELIDARLEDSIDLDAMARAAGFSRFHFLRAFRKRFHQTPHQYLTRMRIERAKELLSNTEYPITEICFSVGFESLGSFSALFHKVVGWSPSVYRARVWEQRRNPRRFIPACFIAQFGLERCLPDPPAEVLPSETRKRPSNGASLHLAK
ncbi:MAG: AraC family transcriptional regulator [Chloroflexi bacterium]|nr:AraC family transcriptional regulator [Chloroflexota bacterium]